MNRFRSNSQLVTMHFKTICRRVLAHYLISPEIKPNDMMRAKIVLPPPADPPELARTVNKYIQERNSYNWHRLSHSGPSSSGFGAGGDYVNQFTCFPDESLWSRDPEFPANVS